MNTIVRRSPLALTLAAGALATLAAPADATPRSWNNAAGGAAATSTNWNPVGVPVAADVLSYGMAGSYAVTFNASAATDAQNNFNAGTVSISASSPHTTTGQIVVALTGSSTVNLTGGQFNCGGTIAIASGSALTGVLNVTGPTASLIATNSAGPLRIGNGNSSSGTLNVLNGGLMQSAGGVILGAFNSSQGTLLVSGVNGANHSQLVTTDATLGDFTIGSAGNGSLTLAAGGLVTIADDLTIAPTSGFTGSMTIGSLTADNSIATVAGDALISRNTSAAAAGTGTVTLNTNGQMLVTGAVSVGDPNGGSGTVIVDATTNGTNPQLRCHDLTIDPANGTLDFRSGLIEVNGGTFSPPTSSFSINGSLTTSLPILKLAGGATLNLTALNVGTTRSAIVSIINSSLSMSAVSILGNSANSTGSLSCSGFGSTINHDTLDVGASGSGLLSISSFGTVTGLSANVALNVGSQGTVTVNGAGSSWNLGNLFLGGSNVAQGGDGDLTVSNGGVVNVTGSTRLRRPTSLLTLNNGTIHSADLELSNGSITGNGLVDASISVVAAVSSITASGGPLTLGKATDGAGFNMLTGTINVGAQTVTLLDLNQARLGNVTLAGGTLSAPNGLLLAASSIMSGNGLINADMSTSANTQLTPTGTGITLGGVLSPFGTVSGTTLTFASGGGLTGSGALNTQVITQNGSTITATGPLALGQSPTLPDACTLGGTLLCGTNNQITLFDAVRPLITGTVDLQDLSTIVVSPAGVQLKRIGVPQAVIRGSGHISNALYNNGLVSPGSPTGDRTQTIFPEVLYTQTGLAPASPGTLEIDIESSAAGGCDKLWVLGGNAVLNGTLIVHLLDGFTPGIGQEFTIVEADAVTGTFPIVIAQGFNVVYTPTTVKLVFIGICDSADFDCDEDFGTDADIEAFFRCLGGVCPSNCNNDADFNNDGDFGTDADIEAFFRVLGGGSCY